MKRLSSAFLLLVLCFTFSIGVFADHEAQYVFDHANLLSESEVSMLEAEAARISEETNIGVYMITVTDYKQYSEIDVANAAITLFELYDLGIGDENDGILLILSMAERDYYVLSHGTEGNIAFSYEAKSYAEDRFLDDFGDNDWYFGFSDYLDASEYLIGLAKESTPYGSYSSEYSPYDTERSIDVILMGLFPSLIIGVLISFLICHILKKKMISVAEQNKASGYLAGNGITITNRQDQYIRTTVTRTKIQRNDHNSRSSGGRSSRSSGGGGYSGKGGKF